jgi:TonB-linked SusC/RagA family outer membrane protein
LYYHLHPGFTLKANIGYTDLNGQEFLKSPISVNPPNQISSSTRGSADFGTNKRTSWIIEPQLNYNLARRSYDLNVLAGLTFQESNSAFQRVSASGYTSDALIGSLQGATTLFQSDESTRYKYTAFFGRLGLTYKDRYLINLTGRRDGSSRFGPGNRFGNFGAIGTAWIFSNEDFLANSLLSLGKLRASIGTTGNDQIGDYQYYNAYKVNFNTYQGSATLAPAALYNPDFGWEITKKLEAGIELGFFNDRVVMELSAYRNRSSNQLIQYRLPATTGFQSVLSNFNATIENSGIESMIKTINFTSDNFSWSSSLNVSLPENKLLAFPDIEESSYAKQYKVGASLSVQRLYSWTGVDPITGYHTIKDTNEDGMLNDDDKTMMGSLDRKYYGGFNNVLRYKNLELTILLQFSKHNAFRYSSNAPGFRGNQLAEVLNRWQHEGDVTEVQRFSQSFFPAYINFAYASQSDFSIVDASFVRIKTFSLSFFIPEQLAAQLKMKDAKIYVQGQNLLTISNYVNLDPETGSQLPPLRMLIAGVQLNF